MCRRRFSTDTSPPPRVWLSRPPLGLTKDRSDSVSRPWRSIGLICGSRNKGGIMAADKKRQKEIKEGTCPTSSAGSVSECRQDQ